MMAADDVDLVPNHALTYEPETTGVCAYCGARTHWIEWNFLCWLCAGTCHESMWRDYLREQRRLGPPSLPTPEPPEQHPE